jgi:hypothetical protein
MTRLTDPEGHFDVPRAPGRVNLMEVSALGYHTHVDTVYVAAEEDPLNLEIRLGVDAVPLDPLVVVASSRPVWESTQPEYLWEFFEREQFYSRLGEGRFFDRAELDRRFGEGGSLQQIPTLFSGPMTLLEARGACGGTVYFLDGIEWKENSASALGGNGHVLEDPLQLIPWGIGDLAAVEVYDWPFPVEFTTHLVYQPLKPPVCRAVVMWTQRPVVPEGTEEESRDPGLILPILALLGLVFGLVAGGG